MVKGRHIEERLIRANPVSRPEHLHDDPAESEALLALILERRDEMTITKPAPTRPGRQPRWRPALVASAAGVLVLMVIGVAALIGFTGGDSEIAGPGTAPAMSLLDGSWEHRTSTAPFDMDRIVPTSIGFFAAGSFDGILMSEDGSTWRVALPLPRGELIPGTASPPEGATGATTTTVPPGYTTQSVVKSIVEFDGEVFAFVTIAEEIDTPSMTVRHLAYRTGDGMDWESVASFGEPAGDMSVAGQNEILLVSSPEPGEGAILRSEDGLAWVRHEPDYDVESIGYLGDRYLAVTVDESADGYPWGKRSMIESINGIEWQEVPGSDFPANAFPSDPTLFEGRIYMGGLLHWEDTGEHGAIFISDDGAAWSQAVVPAIAELRFVSSLTTGDHGLLALGEAMWSEDPQVQDRLVPMTIVDGATFVEIPHPSGLFDGASEAGAYSGSNQVVVYRMDHDSGTFHEWIWSPTG